MGLTVGGRIHRLPYPHPQCPYFDLDKLVKIAHLLSLMVPPFRDDDQAGLLATSDFVGADLFNVLLIQNDMSGSAPQVNRASP
jgi:hypothetical protein